MRTTTKKATTTDQRIEGLEPGAMIEISRNDQGVQVYAERSGDGKRLRIFRIKADGEHVLGYDIVINEEW
ncbi:MAG: hypothetical protein LAO51_17830 [Acidobacteriia bacterium]|nr:hypothetical protein [Terriglobia bacterium]